jgi:CubicO group peptidase (beta-lactamase class C family)
VSYGEDARIADRYKAKNLGAVTGRGWYTADKDEPICDTMERLGTLPFVAQPGEAYVYGYNTDILGCIAEKASGEPLDQLIRTRITEPLGMKDTMFYLPARAARSPRHGLRQHNESGGKIFRAPGHGARPGQLRGRPAPQFLGGAGLLSTARDYARFLEAIRRGGAINGARILSPRARRADDDQPERHAALRQRPRLRLRLRDDGSLRREGARVGRLVRVGRRVRIQLPCGPESASVWVLMLNQMPNASTSATGSRICCIRRSSRPDLGPALLDDRYARFTVRTTSTSRPRRSSPRRCCPASASRDACGPEQKPSDEGADDAHHDVADDAKPAPLVSFPARKPATRPTSRNQIRSMSSLLRSFHCVTRRGCHRAV